MKTMFDVMGFLNSHYVLFKHQYGFRPKHYWTLNVVFPRALFWVLCLFHPHVNVASCHLLMIPHYLSPNQTLNIYIPRQQKRCLLTIHNAPYNSHTEPFFIQAAGILKI